MSYKRTILTGKGGSGKDHLRIILVETGFRYCISHTSRPIREDEEDGKDYYFISYEDAITRTGSGFFYEWVEFNGWIYGTSKDEFIKSNLSIMTPSGIKKLDPEDRKESVIVYLDIPESDRRKRLSKRRDADNVDRRIEADNADFFDFSDYDLKITNPDFILDDYLTEHIKILNKDKK